jgi:hypothetical protein
VYLKVLGGAHGPQSSSNDGHTRYQAQDWQGPEAGLWLVPGLAAVDLLRPRRAAAWLGAQRRGRQPHSHMVDTVRVAMTGTLAAGQLAAGLAAVVAAVALTQLAAARRFAGLIHRD